MLDVFILDAVRPNVVMPSVSAPLKSILFLFLEMKEIALEAKQVAFKTSFVSQRQKWKEIELKLLKKKFWKLRLAEQYKQHVTVEAGNTKGEVSLYHWPPVWLVWISLFCK